MVEKIDVNCVARLIELRTELRRTVVIELELKVGVFVDLPAPAPQYIFTRDIVRIVELFRGRRRVKRDVHTLAVVSLVHIALHRERIARIHLPVRAESTLPHLPIVEWIAIHRSLIRRQKRWMKLRGAAERHAIDPKIEPVSVSDSIAEFAHALINIPTA